MFRRLIRNALLVLCAGVFVQCKGSPKVVTEDGADRQPDWHFVRQDQPASETTLTSIYGNSSNELYVVGWGGTIVTNRTGSWQLMSSPTTVNLTSITGVENGAAFKLDAGKGEMIAVGWYGTVLYYNPNPDGDPQTDDGAWSLIASAADPTTGQPVAPDSTQPFFSPLLRPDAVCGDFDGDGRADDGDGDGWIGNVGGLQHICADGQQTGCDDNCRTTANGDQRPLGDADGTGCVGPGSMPDTSIDQVDKDDDGIGIACDADDTVKDPVARFDSTLFSVWANANGTDLQVIAVGANGALVSFSGVSSAGTPTMAKPAVNNYAGWYALQTLPFRYVDDCDDTTPPGGSCTNGRLPPSCPAQCNPIKTTCSCPTDQGQCCDATATTGNPPAANACGGDGNCSDLCPTCFRRLSETLRGISVDGNDIAAVGADGTIVWGVLNNLFATWSAPSCANPPKPLDDKPVIAAVAGGGGGFEMAGAAGAIFRASPSAACNIQSRTGAPQGFLSAVLPTGGDSSYIVGDEGTFIQVQGATLTPIVTQIAQNLYGIWENASPLTNDELTSIGQDPSKLDPTTPQPNVTRYWLVGAGGTIVEASFF